MQPFPPPCPHCGNGSPQKVSEHKAAAIDGMLAPPPNSPPETIYVFKCSCGVTFAHSIKHEQAKKSA